MMYDTIQQLDQKLDLGPFEIFRCAHCSGLNIGRMEETFFCAWCHTEGTHNSHLALPLPV
ncbi:MAG: hypothetical protein AABZ60_00790 [Planctomycetota bacterium]